MSMPNAYYTNTRQEVAQFLPIISKHCNILEVGCGVGNFRKNILGQCDYWGIEPFADAALVASAQLDKVLVGTFRDVFDSLPDCFFDCVICADVIEHMDDTDWFLQAIKRKMKRKAVIVASIPNVRFIRNLWNLLFRKDWRYVDSGILDKTHIRFFTEKSLKRTLESNGYLVEELKGINALEIDNTSMKRLIFSLGAIVASYVIGNDCRFLQFGFRATQEHS